MKTTIVLRYSTLFLLIMACNEDPIDQNQESISFNDGIIRTKVNDTLIDFVIDYVHIDNHYVNPDGSISRELNIEGVNCGVGMRISFHFPNEIDTHIFGKDSVSAGVETNRFDCTYGVNYDVIDYYGETGNITLIESNNERIREAFNFNAEYFECTYGFPLCPTVTEEDKEPRIITEGTFNITTFP